MLGSGEYEGVALGVGEEVGSAQAEAPAGAKVPAAQFSQWVELKAENVSTGQLTQAAESQ